MEVYAKQPHTYDKQRCIIEYGVNVWLSYGLTSGAPASDSNSYKWKPQIQMHHNRKVFDIYAQEVFARVSGDTNPIHLDPLAARRTFAGIRIVHGIQPIVWALDVLASRRAEFLAPASMRVQFLRPIYINDTVDLDVSRLSSGTVKLRLSVSGEEVSSISLNFEPLPSAVTFFGFQSSRPTAPPKVPNDYTLQEMHGVAGSLAFGPCTSELRTLFPDAVARFGFNVIAALVSSSSLVGMVVPGLHSMFSGLNVSFIDSQDTPDSELQFAVSSISERFRLVKIDIRANGILGTLDTISRLPPIRQLSAEHSRSIVIRDEFKRSISLVVGGSRGIGELTAKLLAAGGADVSITYVHGRRDAEMVQNEILGSGGTCKSLRYDVCGDPLEQLSMLSTPPTHVLYFATPPIFLRKECLLDLARLNEFNSYYLSGFFKLAQACLRLRPQGVRIFYPSSTAIDKRSGSMTEYTMAKSAGEILCADIARFMPGVEVLVRRLPGLPTDQTSSVTQGKLADPVQIVLPILRELCR